jgi:hypothetical protein
VGQTSLYFLQPRWSIKAEFCTRNAFEVIHRSIHRVSTILGFLHQFDAPNHYLYSCVSMCLTVRRSSSRRWAEMQIRPDVSSLNLIGTQVSKHCRNCSVRAMRVSEKCREIVSRCMEHSVDSQSPKKQRPPAREVFCYRALVPCIVHVIQTQCVLIPTRLATLARGKPSKNLPKNKDRLINLRIYASRVSRAMSRDYLSRVLIERV